MKQILLVFMTISFLLIGCKKEIKKEQASFKVSGMTCEIGCAKTITSKLTKQEGVLNANIIFKDSIATIEYDANVTNKADLMAFVNGVGDGKTYTTSDLQANKTTKKACDGNCKKACCEKEEGSKLCAKDCKEDCCKDGANTKPCETANCSKACCDKKDGKACDKDCKEACCKSETAKKACDGNCKKACCKKEEGSKLCAKDCKEECCKDGANAKPCETANCSKACCDKKDGKTCDKNCKEDCCKEA